MKSPKPWSFPHQMTRVTSQELNCLWMAASRRCSEPIADRIMTRSSETCRVIPSSSSYRPRTSFRFSRTKPTNALTFGDRSECAGITRLIGVGAVPQPGKTGASDPFITNGSPTCVGSRPMPYPATVASRVTSIEFILMAGLIRTFSVLLFDSRVYASSGAKSGKTTAG